MKYQCPCCGNYTLEEPAGGTYEICEVCYWENDALQNREETLAEGANRVSLREARENYRSFGACEAALIPHVREPRADELPEANEEASDELPEVNEEASEESDVVSDEESERV